MSDLAAAAVTVSSEHLWCKISSFAVLQDK